MEKIRRQAEHRHATGLPSILLSTMSSGIQEYLPALVCDSDQFRSILVHSRPITDGRRSVMASSAVD